MDDHENQSPDNAPVPKVVRRVFLGTENSMRPGTSIHAEELAEKLQEALLRDLESVQVTTKREQVGYEQRVSLDITYQGESSMPAETEKLTIDHALSKLLPGKSQGR